MAKVWYGVPSARPVAEAQLCFDAWRAMGYAVCASRKSPDLTLDLIYCMPTYPGLWAATNVLAKAVLKFDPECQIFVTGGDDVFPDPDKHADEIAAEFVEHFNGTLGVMQPKGPTRGHDRCAWAPWLGRDWILRGFGGRGPTESAFWHNFGDAYLYAVAERLGRLWERADLKVEHRKWNYQSTRQRPPHLIKARDRWQADKLLYERLMVSGYPGSDLLPEDAA